jgi:haloalkane dehalogenase
MRIGELLRERGIYDKVSIWCFCSINSISQYTMEELVLAGIGTVFIGLESKLFDQDHSTVHQVFSKRKGREPSEVFADLRKHGILSVISTVFGWDFHTRENIQTDMEYLVALKSPYYQIAPLTAYPGTPLFQSMAKEGRIFKDYSWRDICFWNDDVFQRAHFERGEIRQFINRAYDMIYQTNGPSLLSMTDIMAEGYHTLSQSDNPHLRQRANRYRLFVKNIRVLLYAMKKLAPSPAVAQRVEEVEDRCRRYLGPPSAWQRIVSRLVYRKMLPIHKKGEKINWEIVAKLPWKITYYDGEKSKPKVKIQHGFRRGIRNAIASVFSQV